MTLQDRAAKALAVLGDQIDKAGSVLSFGLLNPWVVVQDFAPDVTAQIAAQGGGAVSFQIGSSFSEIGSFTIALLWDDEILAAAPVTVEEDQNLVVKLNGPPKGERLSVWADSVVPISTGPVVSASQADELAAKLAAQSPPKSESILDAGKNAVTGLVDRFFDFEKSSTQTALVVLGLVVLGYFLLKGPVDRIAGKVGG